MPVAERKPIERSQGSSFDPELFDQIQSTIEEQLGGHVQAPDVEDQILGASAQTEEEQELLKGQYCYELINSPVYIPILQSWLKMVDREHAKFENAETDPGDRLRINWRAWQGAVGELVSNIESAAELYRESLK
jgi:hypothetical protein